MNLKYMTQDEREKLYEEVWDYPLAEIAEKYEISEATMRKHLKRLKIPLPPRGYWQRIANGESVQKIDLPPVIGELKKYIRNYVIRFRTDIDEISDEELSSKVDLHLLREDTKKLIIEKCSNIKVANQLRNPHQLISKHKEEVPNRRKIEKGLKKSKTNTHLASLKSESKAILPIRVSKSNLNRAYRILDVMLKSLDELEGNVSVAFIDNQDIGHFVILYTSFQFELLEENNSLVLKILAKDWMSFRNSSRKENLEFKDTPKQPMENQLGKIIYQLFVIANNFFADYKMEERIEKREEEERERQRKLEKMRRGELEEVKQLTQAVADWDKARKIREFASDMELKLHNIKDDIKREKLSNWLKWARDKADWIDPLVEKDDELLGKKVSLFDQILQE